MLWLKAFHIVFVIAWFAGIFYLPRVFVYHAAAQDDVIRQQFVVMERRLFGMMTFGAVGTVIFAVAMLIANPAYLQMPWMHAKLLLVALIIVHHVMSYRCMVAFREGRNTRSPIWFRVFNEAPLFLLIGVVLLVVLKPNW
jgi:protoporphyrinogen IX oxidase